MLNIDLNCDMGEGMDNEAAIMPHISSSNIACGYHAGDEDTMEQTILLALQHKVAIGAHPSYPDREHFGRIDLADKGMTAGEIQRMVQDQLELFQKICRRCSASLHHVKPHGALYNRAAKDKEVCAAICRGIRLQAPGAVLYGLSGSVMEEEAKKQDLLFMREVFADRTYQDDGSLTPRQHPQALIDNEAMAINQVLTIIKESKVTSIHGKEIPLMADTICIHGDGRHAIAFAQKIATTLRDNNIGIRPKY